MITNYNKKTRYSIKSVFFQKVFCVINLEKKEVLSCDAMSEVTEQVGQVSFDHVGHHCPPRWAFSKTDILALLAFLLRSPDMVVKEIQIK